MVLVKLEDEAIPPMVRYSYKKREKGKMCPKKRKERGRNKTFFFGKQEESKLRLLLPLHGGCGRACGPAHCGGAYVEEGGRCALRPRCR